MSWGEQSTNPRLRWAPLLIALAFFTAWEAASRLGWISALFFPPPSLILQTMAKLFANGELPANIAATLGRLFSGFLWRHLIQI